MLKRLSIQDFALIERLTLDFEPGLNIFTGETGAGKSIVLDALALILGERASAEMVRSDREQAYVEALFDVSGDVRVGDCLAEHGLAVDPDGLLISREMTRGGKNRCFVNGRSTVLSCLKELGDLLVDIHGQHEHQRLLSVSHHLEVLDAFGDASFRTFRDRVRARVAELREATAGLEALERGEREKRAESEILEAEAAEIDTASPRPGEDVELEREWRLLSRAEEIRDELSELSESLGGESDDGPRICRRLARYREQLDEVASADPALSGAAKELTDAYYLLEEVRTSVEHYLSDFGSRPERLAELEERLGVLNRLKRRFGPTCEAILLSRERIGARLAGLAGEATARDELAAAASAARRDLARDLPELSRRRKRLAELLERRVTSELSDLSMPGAVFQVKLAREAVAGPPGPLDLTLDGGTWRLFRDGLERAEFFVSTNPGEPLMPLVKVASGGELSRVTLALKSSLAVLEAVPIMVFDEIDSGIGGETATHVARKLVEVSRRAQCLVITHLPQIACRGELHYAVRKQARKERTVVAVERLDGPARAAEVSRMLGGRSEMSLKLAEEMLAAE